MQSSRKLYHEEEVHGNITEFIGASNNLIGIVENKMTVFDVNSAEQHNKVYYGKLIHDVIRNENEMTKFYTYLKQFANPKPKSFFRTSIYDLITTDSNEGITNYVNEFKESGLNGIVHTESQGQYRVEKNILYRHYQRWCETAGEVFDKWSKLREKISELDKPITFERYKENGVTPYGFFFSGNFNLVWSFLPSCGERHVDQPY